MATWPSTLPGPMLAGYALNPMDQSIRTDMEVGAARSRRRTVTRSDKLPVSWTFTDAQMAIFRAWFENASTGADGGAGWFTLDLYVGDGGYSSKTCRFVGPFQSAMLEGHNWRIGATLEVAA